MTDDRRIAESMSKDPEYHAEKAQQFINKMAENLKKPGVTAEKRNEIEAKMKGIYNIKRKFENGIPLDKRRI
jgi:(p)ppGpp synthase/HD superfamily hydrolase